jgi:hypothetical protein
METRLGDIIQPIAVARPSYYPVGSDSGCTTQSRDQIRKKGRSSR